MFRYSSLLLVIASVLQSVATGQSGLAPRANCNDNFSECSPKGAVTSGAPAIGDSLSTLYVDLLNSVNKVQNVARDVDETSPLLRARASGSMCCADGTECLLMQNLNLPFCYDKFTTNFFLPGGAYGTAVTGNYTSSDGVANLLSGEYTLADGTHGNVYGSPSSPSKPDTATLTVPTQYTAAGVGSAIPLSALGEWSVYTTTIPGTMIPPSTVPAQTLPPSIVSDRTVEVATTKPATTIPGTTIPPVTSVVSTFIAKPSSANNAAPGIRKDDIILAGSAVGSVFVVLLWL